MKKRILAFVMALVLIVSMLPVVTFAATTDTRYLKLMANTDKELVLESVKGAPVYTKNVPATFTDESGAEFSGWAQELTTVTNEATDEWNLKFFYDDSVSRWTAVLKGAKLDAYNDATKKVVKNASCIVGAGSESYAYDFRLEIHQDSYLEGYCMLMGNGSNRWTSVNILSSGEQDLLKDEIRNEWAKATLESGSAAPDAITGATLTFSAQSVQEAAAEILSKIAGE